MIIDILHITTLRRFWLSVAVLVIYTAQLLASENEHHCCFVSSCVNKSYYSIRKPTIAPATPKVDSILSSCEYQFAYKKDYFIKQNFSTSNFSAKRIDIYNFNLASSRDSFKILIHDPLKGERFILPHKGPLTSGFGPRALMGGIYHYGIDIGLREGDTVRAALNGLVRLVRSDEYGYGNFVVLTHRGGLETLYGHLSNWLVEDGQIVKAGQAIGLGGTTGRSTGPHLHFEFRFLGDPFDPEPLICFKTRKLYYNEVVLHKEWFNRTSAHNIELAEYYTVERGETLEDIADRYNIAIERLWELNAIKPNAVVRTGRKIRIQ
jgi:murein DD-endopeptidase MepM/ murein hydrolase activator NlpD